MPGKRKNSDSSKSQYNSNEDTGTGNSSSEELEQDTEAREEEQPSPQEPLDGDAGGDSNSVAEDKKPPAKKTNTPPKKKAKLRSPSPLKPKSPVAKKIDSELHEDSTPKPKQIDRRVRCRRRTIVIDEKEEKIPNEQRKTSKGGYWLTGSARSRISAANTGNIPWNKGMHRSSAERAKIAAGVKARNHTLLLQKLERLGMTMEEYQEVKLKTKNLRDHIRKNGGKCKTIPEGTYLKKLHRYHEDGEDGDKHRKVTVVNKVVHVQAPAEKGEEEDESLHPKHPKEDPRIQAIFPKQIGWTPLAFEDFNLLVSYENMCPTGGPGGLICCEACSQRYTKFVGSAMDDLESQRLKHEMEEVKELNQYLEHTQNDLIHTIDKARNKTPAVSTAAATTGTIFDVTTNARISLSKANKPAAKSKKTPAANGEGKAASHSNSRTKASLGSPGTTGAAELNPTRKLGRSKKIFYL